MATQKSYRVTSQRSAEITQKARDLLLQAWASRASFVRPDATPEEVVRAAPEFVITKVLGFSLLRVEQISAGLEFETAGIVDSECRQITLAQRQKLECRRFTLAHEIGHIVLHPGQTLHRDRPLDGSQWTDYTRPTEEQEADLFASHFLMPEKLLTEIFIGCFGERIVGDEPNQDLCYVLAQEVGRAITLKSFAEMRPIDRAMMIAGTSSSQFAIFDPLAKRFAVSRTAMAIRLLRLRLVS